MGKMSERIFYLFYLQDVDKSTSWIHNKDVESSTCERDIL